MSTDCAARQVPTARPYAIGVGLVTVMLGCGSAHDIDPSSSTENLEPSGPLGADLFLADLTWESSGLPRIGQPTNLTRRPGYDNHPHFVPDGSGMWYTAIDELDGQADIWRYDFDTGMVARVTMSNPESEYSATPLPDGSGISTVRVEADSTQRLWRFDPDGSNAAVILENVEPVGYHAWIDETSVVIFVLGEPSTLLLGDVRSGRAKVVAEEVGRSIQRIPDSNDVSYVQRHADGTSTIMRLPGDGSEVMPLIEGVEGGDFHAWAHNGTLLMAHESVVYALPRGSENGWEAVVDFSAIHVLISRLAVSPDGSQIVMVGELDMIREFPVS